jgi:hypothetical protein
MKIEKIFLKDFERPQVIENHFPRFSKLHLTTIENKNKLINSSVEIPTNTQSDLEQKVKETLTKLKDTIVKEPELLNSDDEEITLDSSNNIQKAEKIEDFSKPEYEYEINSDNEEDIKKLKSKNFPDDKSQKDFSEHDDKKDSEIFDEKIFPDIPDSHYNYVNQTPISTDLKNTYQKSDPIEDPEEIEYNEEPDVPVNINRRADLLWSLKKFQLYQANVVPSYNEFTSTEELEKILKEVKRESILKENINESKKYITFLWFAIEKLCTQYLSIDLSGFTSHEAQHMDEYHKVLLELGERSYLNWSDGLPPEIKLVYIMLSHAGTFHIQKTTNVSNIFNIIKKGEMKGPKPFS